jgi:glycosyltransferase involved in cell wall biosynthesis
MTDPKVSVIVPHYNDLAGLGLCLDALDRQSFPRDDFEVIIGDNASPCGIAEVERVARGRARVVLVEEKGAGPARNGAVLHARGEILAFVDSDCVPDPEWLAVGAAAVRPGHFVGGKVFVIRPQKELNGAQAYELLFAFDNETYVRKKNFTGSGNLFVTKTDFERVGPFRVGVSEDKEWSHRALQSGMTIGYAEGAAVGHPPRDDFSALLGKTRRIEKELFLYAMERRGGRAKWMLRSLLMPGMILKEGARVARAPEVAGVRLKALGAVVKLRLWRSAAGLRHSLGLDL